MKLRRVEAVVQSCSVISILKNISKLIGKHLCPNLFFMKLNASALQPATLLKKIPTQVFSCGFCEIFKNSFSYRASLLAASRHGGEAYFCKEKIWLLYILLIQKLRSLDREHLCQISKAILKLVFCVLTSSHYTKPVIKFLEEKQHSRNLRIDLFIY